MKTEGEKKIGFPTVTIDDLRDLYQRQMLAMDLIRRQPSEEMKVYELLFMLQLHHLPTFNHSQEVGYFAGELGRIAGFNEETLRILTVGGKLHDIGKLIVPTAVLNRTNSDLSEPERELLTAHGYIGALIIDHVELNPIYATFAQEHHIGNSTLANLDVQLVNRHPLTPCVSIGDVLSAAMDPSRLHRTPWTLERTIVEINRKFEEGIFPRYLQGPFNEMIQIGIHPQT